MRLVGRSDQTNERCRNPAFDVHLLHRMEKVADQRLDVPKF